MIHVLESALRVSIAEEQRLTIVVDLNGFTMSNLDVEAATLLINMLQTNYPDTMGATMVINAPFLFSSIYSLIQPLLSPITASKVLLLGDAACLLDHVEEHLVPDEIAIALPQPAVDPSPTESSSWWPLSLTSATSGSSTSGSSPSSSWW